MAAAFEALRDALTGLSGNWDRHSPRRLAPTGRCGAERRRHPRQCTFACPGPRPSKLRPPGAAAVCRRRRSLTDPAVVAAGGIKIKNAWSKQMDDASVGLRLWSSTLARDRELYVPSGAN